MIFGPFFGENNRLRSHALDVHVNGRKAGSFLQSSENVLIDDTGRIERRDGFTEALPATTGRSLVSLAGKMLFSDGASLKRVSFEPYAVTTIDTVADHRIAYAESNGEIYYSDGAKLACVEAAGTVRLVGVPIPAGLTVTTTSGDLPPAWYQVTITYFNGVEEGGSYPSQSVELTATGGIHLALPSAPAGVTNVGVYLSGPNGEVPLLYNVVAPGTASLNLTTEPTGRALQTQFKAPMPAGDLLAFHDSRLLVADGSTLYYSDPYNYGMTTPSKNYLLFPSDITVLQPCVNGIYLVAGETYWFPNIGTDAMALAPILPYGAVKFTSGEFPNEKKVFWLSERGLVVGDAQGQVKNIQEGALLLALSGSGASLFVEGNDRIVATNG